MMLIKVAALDLKALWVSFSKRETIALELLWAFITAGDLINTYNCFSGICILE